MINELQFQSESLKNEYDRKGFTIIPGIISKYECNKISKLLVMKPTGKKSQFFRAHSIDNSIPIEIMNKLSKHVSDFCGKPVYPSYAFAIEYKQQDKDVMEAHYDTFANPISMTLCIENNGNNSTSSPLFIDPAKFNNPFLSRVTISTGHVDIKNKVGLDLNEGDLGIFRGREHLHWREHTNSENFKGILIHFFDYSVRGTSPTQKYIKKLPFRLFKGSKRFINYDSFRDQMSLFF